ncbi:sugar phosphate isomerase/epimerase family protein [Peribacillus butanolivorans]|uniref:sugar phosphate isomerase/epimerase family protein n=1 Tax=Peribacillus butanolivorans TaxID=421767 RepID=UPI0037FDE563
MVAESNLEHLVRQVDDICSLIIKLPPSIQEEGQQFPTPYLVLIDWGHNERDYTAGHPDDAKRLSPEGWNRMTHIRIWAEHAWTKYGVRSVVHPHDGGYIEFKDEIKKLMQEIPHEIAGFCLDTGHLYYSKMDPVQWLMDCANRLDYIHFKDINLDNYQKVMTECIRFFDACGKGVICFVGQGIIDYKSINRLLKEIDYHGYITVEQERDPRNCDSSLRDVSQSFAYLKNIGF